MPDDIYSNGTYAKMCPEWHAQDSAWKAGHLHSLLSRDWQTETPASPVRVVEVGCGFGGVLAEFCALLRANGVLCQGTGYDPSPHAVAEAARRHPELIFCRGDFRDATDHYELGLMVDVLEHVEKPVVFIRHALDHCDRLLLHIPLDEHWYGNWLHPRDYYEYLRRDRGHIHYFDRRSALAMLRDAGAEVLHWRYTPWGVDLYRHAPEAGRIAPLVYVLRIVGMRLWPDACVRALGGASMACLCRKAERRVNSSQVAPGSL